MIQKRHSRGRARWDVRWREEGRQRSRTFDLRKDAERFEQDTRRRLQQGVHGTAEPSRETLREWTGTWWDRHSADWAKSTRLQRAQLLDKWILPYVGGVRLRDLGRDRLDQWQADIRRDGCSPNQRNASLRVLSAALGVAVTAGRLPTNPCAGRVKAPHRVTRPKALTPAEVERIRGEMPTERDAVLVTLMAYGGLRPEEALALRWGDVTDGQLTVERAWTVGELKGTKNGRIRTVELCAEAARDLEAYRPPGVSPAALVAPSQTGGHLDLPNWRRRVWGPAAVHAGFTRTATGKDGRERVVASVSPYDCRHTFASLLLHEGCGMFIVADQMGHRSLQLLEDTYGHILKGLRRNIPMNDAIAESRNPDPDVRSKCDTGNVVDLAAHRQARKTA